MIGHDDPSTNHQSLMLLTILNTIDKNVSVWIAGKDIYPFYYGEGDKIIRLLVVYLIL